MKLLEERIKKDGIVLPGNVLKVDSFLNHQIDPELSKAMGEEFARLFGDAGIDRVLTGHRVDDEHRHRRHDSAYAPRAARLRAQEEVCPDQ